MNLDGLKLAEDLAVGDVVTLGTHEVTDVEILEFARSWDPQWFHLDVDAAAAGPYGGLIASGLHTMAIYQRLYVDSTQWAAIAGRGLPEVRFLRPEFIGALTSFGSAERSMVISSPATVMARSMRIGRSMPEASM